MSVEVGKIGEQNSGLLSFLAGRWTTSFTAYIHSLTETRIRMITQLGGVKSGALFQPLPNGGVAGHYMPIESPAGNDESTADCFFRLELDRSDNSLVAYLGNEESVLCIKGVWSDSVLRCSRHLQ